MTGIAGKVALVTGAGAGLGRAFCELFLKRGGKVCLVDWSRANGKAAKEELAFQYGQENVTFKQCDVAVASELEDSMKHTISTFGGIDILCNNAGIMDESNYKTMIAVNLGAVVQGTFLALRYMGKDKGGNGGVVINTASAAGVCPMPFGAAYSGTKYGVVGFTLSMGFHSKRKEHGVRVNCICPSFTDTELLRLRHDDAVSSKEQYKQLTAKFAIMKPSQVADALPLLIEDNHLNGAILLCEPTGPRLLRMPLTLEDVHSKS